jgi:hypothetical protein
MGMGAANPQYMHSGLVSQGSQGVVAPSMMASQVMAPNIPMQGNYIPP